LFLFSGARVRVVACRVVAFVVANIFPSDALHSNGIFPSDALHSNGYLFPPGHYTYFYYLLLDEMI
jgi:hypothetical protein